MRQRPRDVREEVHRRRAPRWEGLKRAEAKLANAKGYGTYIQFGSKKILGSDTLEALLEEEEHLELLLKLRNNQPHGKVMRLLRKKNKIQRALMEERSK